MAIYVAIEEGYSLQRLNSLKEIAAFSKRLGLTHKDGAVVTIRSASSALKQEGALRVYNYDTETLAALTEGASIREIDLPDWAYKINKI